MCNYFKFCKGVKQFDQSNEKRQNLSRVINGPITSLEIDYLRFFFIKMKLKCHLMKDNLLPGTFITTANWQCMYKMETWNLINFLNLVKQWTEENKISFAYANKVTVIHWSYGIELHNDYKNINFVIFSYLELDASISELLRLRWKLPPKTCQTQYLVRRSKSRSGMSPKTIFFRRSVCTLENNSLPYPKSRVAIAITMYLKTPGQ